MKQTGKMLFINGKIFTSDRLHPYADCMAVEDGRRDIDIETAVILYTRGAAEAAGFRDVGMLIPGYHADFAVLSEDLLTTAPENIDKIRVEETYIDGELIYRNDKK